MVPSVHGVVFWQLDMYSTRILESNVVECNYFIAIGGGIVSMLISCWMILGKEQSKTISPGFGDYVPKGIRGYLMKIISISISCSRKEQGPVYLYLYPCRLTWKQPNLFPLYCQGGFSVLITHSCETFGRGYNKDPTNQEPRQFPIR